MLLERVDVMLNTLSANPGYLITEIEEENSAAAAIAERQYYAVTLAALGVVTVLLIAALYLLICHNYRKRVLELREEEECYFGWNVWRLKATVSELELQKAERIVEDMKKSLSKNFQPMFVRGE